MDHMADVGGDPDFITRRVHSEHGAFGGSRRSRLRTLSTWSLRHGERYENFSILLNDPNDRKPLFKPKRISTENELRKHNAVPNSP